MAGPGEEDTVTRTGYMALHIRVAKTLIAAQDFNREEAEGISDSDWAEDISKFSGTSHIMVWLDEQMKQSGFREAFVVQLVVKCIHCLLWCFENCVKVRAPIHSALSSATHSASPPAALRSRLVIASRRAAASS